MNPLDPDVINHLEFLLVGRALLYAFIFLVLAWVAFTTNNEDRVAVRIAGLISVVLFFVNLIMAIEWMNLFYF
jgi:hypothetical protein